MKKLLLLLLIVPLVSFGQTYEYSNGTKVKVEIVKSQREKNLEKKAARAKEIKDRKAVLAAEQRAINRAKTDYKYFNSGKKKGNAKDYKGAINDLTKFISKYPQNPKGWYARGIYKTWLDDMSGACYDWKRAVELGSNDAQKKLFENCNDDGSVKKRSVKKTYDDWLNQFVKEFDSEDYGAAIKSLSMVIELHTPSPNHSTKDELFMYRHLIKGKIEDFEGALLDVKMAQSINPQGKFRDKTYPEWVTGGENKISSIESTISKEKAIAKLKELKELLELEVITQKDYDKEKAILTPIILGKN